MKYVDVISLAANSQKILSSEALESVAGFINSKKCSDGGYAGRSDESDVYYTFFALASHAVLEKNVCGSDTVNYISSFRHGSGLDLVHSISLLRCRLLAAYARYAGRYGLVGYPLFLAARFFCAAELKTLLSVFMKTLKQGDGASVYDLWLLATAADAAGCSFIDDKSMKALLEKRKCSDGGYVNEAGSSASCVTSTAAGILLWKEAAKGVDEEALAWLKSQQADYGGFYAATGAPIPDVLSTATALAAMKACGADMYGCREKNMEFIQSHWDESGGFCGSLADTFADVEYTFYALLGIGCLAE